MAFATDERSTTTLALIAEALAAAGGVPLKVLADRMACLKGGVVANVVIPTPDYVRFAAHYGFAPDFCHANDSLSKGIVENLVGYAQRDLVVPLLSEGQLSGRPVDVHQANTAAKVWCAEVNAAVHSEISGVPDTRLVKERAVLRPLPSVPKVGPRTQQATPGHRGQAQDPSFRTRRPLRAARTGSRPRNAPGSSQLCWPATRTTK